jgi:hypothetical protein
MVSNGDEVLAVQAVEAGSAKEYLEPHKLDYTTHDAIAIADSAKEHLEPGAILEPGSEILMYAQIQERPHRDFLMHQQGFMSGKTEGDLDSVPGYYGGTASYKFVQNARHLNQMRVTRYKLSRDLGEHHDEYGRVMSDTPAAKLRADALAAAKKVPFVPYSSVGPDMAFKEAGEYGAFLGTHRPFRPEALPYDMLRSARAPYSPYGALGIPGGVMGKYGYDGGLDRYGAMSRFGGYGDRYGRLPSTLYQRLNPTKTRAQLYNELNQNYPAGLAAEAEAAANAAGAV